MKAVQISTPGGPDVLTVVELPTPIPAPGELRVKAQAIGLGRPDVLVRKGTYKWMPPLPAIPGSEMVGVVDSLGSGVASPRPGQRVLVSARDLPVRAGCCAEYICVPASACYLLPEQIDPVDAASLPNLQLANALWECNVARSIDTILIPGASGGVGAILARFARHKGAKVIGTTHSPEKARYILNNGIDHLLQCEAEALPAAVNEVTDGRGVDFAVDQLGGDWLVACLRSLAPIGMLVSINVTLGPPTRDVFLEMRALLARSLALRTFSMHTFDKDAPRRRALMDMAIKQMALGQVAAPQATVLKLSDIRKAHEMLDAGTSMGKLVLQP